MARKKGELRQQILLETHRLLASGGFGTLTFDALANRLGVSKQAIIYWFPTKQDLIHEIAVPGVKSESDATIAAVAGTRDAAEAVKSFIAALVSHHLADLPRFRAIYLAPQLTANPELLLPNHPIMRDVYPHTSRMYRALEIALVSDPTFPADRNARATAVAIHSAGIGLLLMLAPGDAISDPLAHQTSELVEVLAQQLATGVAR